MKNNLPSNFDTAISHRHLWFAVGIRAAGNFGHPRPRPSGFALGGTLLLVLLFRRVWQIVPFDRGDSCPSCGVVLGGTVVILPVRRRRTLVLAGRQAAQSRFLLVSRRRHSRYFGRSAIAIRITLWSRVAVVVARGHRFLWFGLLFLARSTTADCPRPTTRLTVFQTLVWCPMTALRTLIRFPGSPTFSGVGHLWLLYLRAIVFDHLMNLLLIGMMIAVTDRTHVSSLQGFIKLPIMRLFPVWSAVLRLYLRCIIPSSVIL